MAALPVRRRGLREFAEQPEMLRILIEHAWRGLRAQMVVRVLFILCLLGIVVFVPPVHDRELCYAVVTAYTIWTAVQAAVTWRPRLRVLALAWLALFVDIAALTVLIAIAANSQAQTWTVDVLINGYFLIPMLAATQLRVWVCAAVSIPTVAAYLVVAVYGRAVNGYEPWGGIFFSALLLAVVATAAVLLSSIQRSRVLRMGRLTVQRTVLAAELGEVEQRARRALAEQLHDGALQYVLAALQDLDDVRQGEQGAIDRIDHALRESSTLLRSTVGQLHSAVLEQAGLLAGLESLGRDAAARGHFTLEVVSEGWDPELRTLADPILLAAGRELLANVAKHAEAGRVRLTLAQRTGTVDLTIEDDGVGFDPDMLQRRLGEGHVGVASNRLRVQAAGGTLRFRAAQPHGTVVDVQVPVTGAPA